MTNLKFIVPILGYILSICLNMQAQSTFQISLDKTDETIVSDIVISEDNKFLILTLSYNEIEIIKLDENASILSSHQFSKENARFTPEPKIFKKKNGDICLLVPERVGGVTSKITLYVLSPNLDVKTSLVIPNAYPFYDWKHIQEDDNGNIMVWVSNTKNTKLSIQGIKLDNDLKMIWNKEYTFSNNDDLALRSSVIIDAEIYVLIRRFGNTTGSKNYNSLLKIDTNGDVIKSFAFNFDPNHIDKDSQNNIIAIGTTNANQLICAKFDSELNEIWSKEIGFAKVPFGEEKNALVAIEKGFVIDEFDNIYVTIMEANLDEFDGTKLLKLTPEGEVTYSNVLLDGSHTRVDKVLMMNQNILMKINTADGAIITKLDNQLASAECSSMAFCPEIIDFKVFLSEDYSAISRNGPTLQEAQPLSISDTQVSFSNACKSIAQPFADFDIAQDNWCIGEYVEIDHKSLYPKGRSFWQLFHTIDTSFQRSKQPEPFLLLNSGRYTLVHTLLFAGCIYQDSITFEVSLRGKTILDRGLFLCPGDSLIVDLSSLNLRSITWEDGDISAIKTIDKPGTISVTYIDSNGCPNEDKTIIGKRFPPEITLGDDVTICNDSFYTVSITTADDVMLKWNNSYDEPTLVVHQKGNYSVTATNVCGESTDDINVDVKDCETKIYYSNIFSPNGDGANDFFEIIVENANDLSCKIYDRWGNLIFSNFDNRVSWDGKFNNQSVPEGVYIFVLEYTNFLLGTTEILSGNVTLVR